MHFVLMIVIAAVLLTPAPSSAADYPDSSKAPMTAEDSLAAVESLNDGPHVYLESDTSIIAVYLCHGAIDKRRFTGGDTIEFRGLCGDTGVVYAIPMSPEGEQPFEIDDVPRIFAVSDIHGEYEAFVEVLLKGGIIDDSHRWVWGDGHLVVNGDVFDRGDLVTECLWLIYRLQQEARRAGGQVHFVLGNHELMVIRGDNRYIHKRYLDGIARKSRIRHEDLYGPDMELGRWLRTLPTAIRLNDILFVHGGISPRMMASGLSLSGLSDAVRDGLDLSSAKVAFDDRVKLLYGSEGPFWYRGFHYEVEGRYPKTTDSDIDNILKHFAVNSIVVGHTGVDSVMSFYDGKVYAVDVPLEDLGTLQALLWQEGRFYRVTGSGELEPLE